MAQNSGQHHGIERSVVEPRSVCSETWFYTLSIRFTADVGPLVQDSWTIVPLSAVFGESERE